MIIKIFGIAFLFAVVVFILKAFGYKGAPLVAIAALIGILGVLFDRFSAIYEVFEIIKKQDGMSDLVECVLKILGIGYISGICSDVCRELGEANIATAVLTVARIESVALVSPMIIEILTLGLELIK